LAWNKIFGDMEKYFSTCSWMKDIQGWKFGWQMKMDEIFHEHWQHTFFAKNWTKKQGGKNLSWLILKNSMHEMFKSYLIFP
jgi:hypothetical protein